MRQMKFVTLRLIIVVFAGPLSVSCSLLHQPRGVNAGEPEREATKFWEQWLTKCGDFYVARGGDRGRYGLRSLHEIYEWSSPKVEAIPEQLLEADKLTGVEWKGKTRVTFTSRRVYFGGKWTDWKPYEQVLRRLESPFQKKNGKWDNPADLLYTKIDCSSLPN